MLVATPGPPDRPHGAPHRRARRASKCWSWTKPTACSTWASCRRSSASSPSVPAEPPDAAVLGDVRVDSIKQLALEFMHDAEADPGRRAEHHRRDHRAPRASGRRHAQARSAAAHPGKRRSREQTLVFGRTKHGCDRLAEHLEQSGIKAAAIHGNKSQGAAHARARTTSRPATHPRAGRHRHRRARPRHRPAADW